MLAENSGAEAVGAGETTEIIRGEKLFHSFDIVFSKLKPFWYSTEVIKFGCGMSEFCVPLETNQEYRKIREHNDMLVDAEAERGILGAI